MADPRHIEQEVKHKIANDIRNRIPYSTIAQRYGVSPRTIDRIKANIDYYPVVKSDKKVGSFSWREACNAAKGMQEIKDKMSFSQDHASIELGTGDPVVLMGFGDQHIGAYGTDYKALEDITDEIIETPNVYVALTGDYTEMAIRMRGVLEVTSQVLTPDMQEAFLDDWLSEIAPKVAFATWDNHAVMRQEAQAGVSGVKTMLSRRFVYHNGIGHSDIKVGEQVYKAAASHKFRGGSMFNRTHAQGRYVRQEASDRELVLMADIHTAAYTWTYEGGHPACYLTGGTLHTGSGYAHRFFSLCKAIHYPCVVLLPDEHKMVPFATIKDAQRYIG